MELLWNVKLITRQIFDVFGMKPGVLMFLLGSKHFSL